MTLQISLVLGIAVISMVLIMTERLRMDIVAMLVLVSLFVFGLVKPSEALSGFSNQATITIAAMFVLAAGLQSTGALSGVGQLLEKSKTPTTFLLTLFGVLVLIAPFVSNTAIVAVFMPVVIAASLKIGMSPTKSLIPLSYVSQMIGVWTLIGTSSNLLVNSLAQDLGYEGFTMFQFLPLGVICTVVGCIYLLTIGRWTLPDKSITDLSPGSDAGNYVTEFRLGPDSRLIGTSVEEAELHQRYKIYVLELWRNGEKHWAPRADVLEQGDVLLVRGRWSSLFTLQDEMQLEFTSRSRPPKRRREKTDKNDDYNDRLDKRIMTEAMISPNSIVIGRQLKVLERRLYNEVSVLGIQRRGQVLRDRLDETVLQSGDILLTLLPESQMTILRQNKNFIVLSERDEPAKHSWRKPFSLLIMAAVVAMPAFGIMPIVFSALAGAVAMVVTGCLEIDDMYESIDWRIIILMAGLLPLGVAMNSTGAADFIVDHTIGYAGDMGPHVVLAVMYLLALILGELMSNSAAAVLLAPIGISTAQIMNADPTPFLIAITFSASTSFLTPIGYQTNTMVYSAGGYRFSDFIKVGLPLNLIFWVLGVIFIPMFWPFY